MKPRVVRIVEFALLICIVYFVLLAVNGCKRSPGKAIKLDVAKYPCAMGGINQRPLAAPVELDSTATGPEITVPTVNCLSWKVEGVNQSCIASVVIQCRATTVSEWVDMATLVNPDQEPQVWVLSGKSASCPQTRFKVPSYSAGLLRISPIVGDPEVAK